MPPPVRIDVTPLFRQGNEIFCSIDPPAANQKGGMIRLQKGSQASLEFVLHPTDAFPITFRPPTPNSPTSGSEAFWCDAGDCPTNARLDPQYVNPQLTNNNLTLTVDVNPGAADSGVHYRLNFDNNRHFDPIIIHT